MPDHWWPTLTTGPSAPGDSTLMTIIVWCSWGNWSVLVSSLLVSFAAPSIWMMSPGAKLLTPTRRPQMYSASSPQLLQGLSAPAAASALYGRAQHSPLSPLWDLTDFFRL